MCHAGPVPQAATTTCSRFVKRGIDGSTWSCSLQSHANSSTEPPSADCSCPSSYQLPVAHQSYAASSMRHTCGEPTAPACPGYPRRKRLEAKLSHLLGTASWSRCRTSGELVVTSQESLQQHNQQQQQKKKQQHQVKHMWRSTTCPTNLPIKLWHIRPILSASGLDTLSSVNAIVCDVRGTASSTV
jgi:hypothetical protein